MTDDRGAAALAERLRVTAVKRAYLGVTEDEAVAILGERGRFLPDGEGVAFDAAGFAAVVVQRDRMTDLYGKQNAELARLRKIEAAARAYQKARDVWRGASEARLAVGTDWPRHAKNLDDAEAALRDALESDQ